MQALYSCRADLAGRRTSPVRVQGLYLRLIDSRRVGAAGLISLDGASGAERGGRMLLLAVDQVGFRGESLGPRVGNSHEVRGCRV